MSFEYILGGQIQDFVLQSYLEHPVKNRVTWEPGIIL